MGQAWVWAAATALLAHCASCPASAQKELVLTEKDTFEVPAGRAQAEDGAWSLAFEDPDWREVSAAARARLMPTVDRWFVQARELSHLTIACHGDPSTPTIASLDLATAALVAADHRSRSEFSARVVEGSWTSGVSATWRSRKGDSSWGHALGRFELLDTSCEVQAWTRPGGDDGGLESLRNLVERFSGRRPTVVRELAGLSRVLRARIDPDAGDDATITFLVGGLQRLPDAELVERFALRLRLLDSLAPEPCADLIRQRNTTANDALAYLSDADAVRWIRIGRHALELSDGTIPREVEPSDLRGLLRQRPELADAIQTIKSMNFATAEALCEAEKKRLRIALELSPTARAELLRWWLAGH